jgi:hypothetical protein
MSTPIGAVIDDPLLVRAHLREDGTVRRSLDDTCVGQLDNTILECFSKLIQQENITIQLMLKAVSNLVGRGKRPRVVAHAVAILYGREDVADYVGSFLDDVKLYLQDPFLCEQNVPYKNPHCLLSDFEELRMTFDLPEPGATPRGPLSVPEHLKALESRDNYQEWARKPAALKDHVDLQK